MILWLFCLWGFGCPKKDTVFCALREVHKDKVFNHRIRTGYVPASWEHRRRPWRSLSSSWHAQCRWRHHGWHSQGTPSGHHGSPHRWDQRYAWLHPYVQDDGWQAWWYPGCYHAIPSCDAWRLLFQDPFLLYHGQTCLLFSEWMQTDVKFQNCWLFIAFYCICPAVEESTIAIRATYKNLNSDWLGDLFSV